MIEETAQRNKVNELEFGGVMGIFYYENGGHTRIPRVE